MKTANSERTVAGIVVLTDELVRFSNLSAEPIVRQDLIDTITQLLDHDFVDPDKAAVKGSGANSAGANRLRCRSERIENRR